jgi:alkylresorcinol/alkylpyrone synthase
MVLNDVLREHRPAKGTRSLLIAMGPGFCSEMLLLEW